MDNLHWDIESEDNAFLILKSESGVISTLHSSATQWRHKFLIEMIFENGYIIENINDFDKALIFLDENKIKYELSYSKEVLISNGENLLFLGRKILILIEWLAFWR